MTPDPYKDRISDAIRYAEENEPNPGDARARCFVAALSGQLEDSDFELAAKVWALISARPL